MPWKGKCAVNSCPNDRLEEKVGDEVKKSIFCKDHQGYWKTLKPPRKKEKLKCPVCDSERVVKRLKKWRGMEWECKNCGWRM